MPQKKGTQHIVALGGAGFGTVGNTRLLDDYILNLSGRQRPQICFLPTASGDSQSYISQFYEVFPDSRAESSHLSLFRRDDRDPAEHLLKQDVIFVGGGNTANMLAVWRVHGVDRILRTALERGAVLAGVSAGMICWFECGVTDSFGPLAPLHDGLGFLSGSACPHFDGEIDRRPKYLRSVESGELPSGLAADDGVALHFADGQLVEAISSRRTASAYRVTKTANGVNVEAISTRYLGDEQPSASLQREGDSEPT